MDKDKNLVDENNHNSVQGDLVLEKRSSAPEFVFLCLVGIFVIICFSLALGYTAVSARAPLVVMIPLILLMIFHGIKLGRKTSRVELSAFFSNLLLAKNNDYKKIATMIIWMIILAGLIFVTGHYVGIAIFMFILLRFYAKEKLRLSLMIAIIATLVIYGLFEFVFDIQLYRGMIYRIWRGYDVF